jgi:hypothetical protein
MHITYSMAYILSVVNSVHYYYSLHGFLGINLRYRNDFCFSFL